MDWPTAFCVVGLFAALFAYLAYQDHLRAEVMKEALRNGMTEVKFK